MSVINYINYDFESSVNINFNIFVIRVNPDQCINSVSGQRQHFNILLNWSTFLRRLWYQSFPVCRDYYEYVDYQGPIYLVPFVEGKIKTVTRPFPL